MADWTNLPNQAVGVGGLPSGTTVTALRDNPVAIAQGAAGAPRVEDAALDTTATNAGRDWVLARNALAGVDDVGVEVVAWKQTTGNLSRNSTIAGSNLRVSTDGTRGAFGSIPANAISGVTALSGTWRALLGCRGAENTGNPGTDQMFSSLFRRIS